MNCSMWAMGTSIDSSGSTVSTSAASWSTSRRARCNRDVTWTFVSLDIPSMSANSRSNKSSAPISVRMLAKSTVRSNLKLGSQTFTLHCFMLKGVFEMHQVVRGQMPLHFPVARGVFHRQDDYHAQSRVGEREANGLAPQFLVEAVFHVHHRHVHERHLHRIPVVDLEVYLLSLRERLAPCRLQTYGAHDHQTAPRQQSVRHFWNVTACLLRYPSIDRVGGHRTTGPGSSQNITRDDRKSAIPSIAVTQQCVAIISWKL